MKNETNVYEKNLNVLNCLKSINVEKYNFYKEKLLIAEAKKRGYKLGVAISNKYDDFAIIDKNFSDLEYAMNEDGDLLNYGYVLFQKSIWATILETISKEEAEKILNKKII